MKFKIKILFLLLSRFFRSEINNRKTLEDYQKKQLDRFAKKVLKNSPFYAKYILNGRFEWENVPVISKKEFMGHFDEINTQGISKDEAMQLALKAEKDRDFSPQLNGVTVGLSTGTSGKRGLFLVTEEERAKWVVIILDRVLKPKIFKKQKVAFFLRASSNLYSSISSSLFKFKYFDIFQPIEELLLELRSYQPDVLAAQPSVLIDISSAQRKGDISISPNQIISFAEVLHDQDKNFILETFKAPLTEVYQCTEGFLGVSCSEGTIHLNEDLIYFEKEWIDNDKFFPIITDFSRSCQPVVKYRMNDILQIKKSGCTCGSPLTAIERIIGRDDDVIIFESIKIYPDVLARKIAIAMDTFYQYSIVQTTLLNFEIGLACNPSVFEEEKEKFKTVISEILLSYGIENVKLKFQNHLFISRGNKLRKIYSMVK